MLQRFLLSFIVVLSLSALVHADVKRGSVSGGGTRRFTYIPNADGPSEVTMIFDNVNSDLDILVGTDVEGELVFVCQGVSTLRQFERCVFGADDDRAYTILVDSDHGASQFRIYVGTNSNETINIAGRASSLMEEDHLDQASQKMLEKARALRKSKRK
jgi:hypothetical protein